MTKDISQEVALNNYLEEVRQLKRQTAAEFDKLAQQDTYPIESFFRIPSGQTHLSKVVQQIEYRRIVTLIWKIATNEGSTDELLRCLRYYRVIRDGIEKKLDHIKAFKVLKIQELLNKYR